jgi:hypothetical protein
MDESTTVVIDNEYVQRFLQQRRGGFLPFHVEVMIVHFSLHELPENGCEDRRRLQHIDFRQARQLEVIGFEAFRQTSLVSINLVGTITNDIKSAAFAFCFQLQEVVFNRELRVIRACAFLNCVSLHTVDFSNCQYLKKIGKSAFADCNVLERVTIPSTVNYLTGNAFSRNYDVPLDFTSIGVEGPVPLPLAIQLSVAYPNRTHSLITMDQLLNLYSFQRIRPSDLLLPQYQNKSDNDDFHGIDDQVKLREIQCTRAEASRRFVLWCLEKGVVGDLK